MTSQTHPQEVPELVERLRAIQSEALADAFNPDMRSAARLVFEAQEKLFRLLPEILAALTKAAPPVEGALREAVNSAVATLMAVRATASDLDEWRGAADHFSDLCARETRKLNAALQQSRSTPAPVAGNALDAGAALEALKPFAEAADNLDDAHNDRFDIWESGAAMSITAGDLRRAAKAYAATLQSHGQSAGKGVEPLDASREGREG
jgi:hypothetical protein